VGLFALSTPALAQDFGLVTTLTHPDAKPNHEDRFGSGLAISGHTLFVGAKDEPAANDYSGVVHVFSDTDWSEVAQLKSSVDADFEFGASIQLDGDRALISNAAIDNGVVWFFEKAQGAWQEKLRVQGVLDEAFGYRLALRGDFAFIAASRVGTGKVHVYRRVAGTWGEVQVLTASDAQDEDFFGFSIAFDGQRLAISAPGNQLGPKRCGVYTFSRVGDAFVEDGKLAGDPRTHWFGADVGVSGDTLIVNAPPAYQVTSLGKALAYERRGNQWELDSELTVDGEASFPGGVAVDGDTAWFGARANDPRAQNIYAFQRTNGAWHAGQKLHFPTPGEYETAGWVVQDGTLAVGVWNGLSTDSVQVYRGPGHDSSNGGGSSGGSGGAETVGGAAGGAPAEGSAAAGGGSKPSASGGGSTGPASTDPSNPSGEPSSGGASAGHNSQSSERGGCVLAPSSNARAWPLAALVCAMAIAQKRRKRSARG